MQIVKVVLTGVCAVLLAIQFKGNKPEYGIYISLATCLLIFYYAITSLQYIIDSINEIGSYISVNKTYISIFVRIIGITYISEFSSSICKDAGYLAIATQIEIVGKLSILVVSMPILLALLETVNNFLKA